MTVAQLMKAQKAQSPKPNKQDLDGVPIDQSTPEENKEIVRHIRPV